MTQADNEQARLRLCAVSFLNTVPLVWGLLHGRQRGLFEVSFAVPSACAARLEAGEADVGLVPAVEVPRLGLEILPGAGIACRGPVRSILLYSAMPLGRIRTLAADSSSRTSVVLARLVLQARYGASPRVFSQEPALDEMLRNADAALLIGDHALSACPPEGVAVTDLGAEWAQWTGLPFVFAAWACHRRAASSELAAALLESCRFGQAQIETIIAREAPARRLPEELVRDYLTRRIVFELGPREHDGLRLFLERASQSGMLAATGQS